MTSSEEVAHALTLTATVRAIALIAAIWTTGVTVLAFTRSEREWAKPETEREPIR
jgi:hypothetical protein